MENHLSSSIYNLKKCIYIYGWFYAKFLSFKGAFLFWVKIVNFPGINGKFPFYPYSLNVKKVDVSSQTNKQKCCFSIERKRKFFSSIFGIDVLAYTQIFACGQLDWPHVAQSICVGHSQSIHSLMARVHRFKSGGSQGCKKRLWYNYY